MKLLKQKKWKQYFHVQSVVNSDYLSMSCFQQAVSKKISIPSTRRINMGNKENLIQNWNFLVDWGDFQTRKPIVKAGVYGELDILWNYTENELCHTILM